MEFGIYEEFPTGKNLQNLEFIDFPAEIVVAAKSLPEFEGIRDQIKSGNKHLDVAYWPVLERGGGYWVSPFSKNEPTERVLSELEARTQEDGTLRLHWDSELPIITNLSLLVKQIPNFRRNKKRLNNFLRNHKANGIALTTTEPPSIVPEFAKRALGIAVDPEDIDCDKSIRSYSSFRKHAYRFLGEKFPDAFYRSVLKREARNGVRQYGDRFSIGLGCIGTGIVGNEPSLTPEELFDDIQLSQDEGVEKAYIFRLGGMTSEHADVLKNFRSE